MLATISFYEKNNVIDRLWKSGSYLIKNMKKIVTKYNLDDSVIIGGIECLPFYKFIKNNEYDEFNTKKFQHEMGKSEIIMRN